MPLIKAKKRKGTFTQNIASKLKFSSNTDPSNGPIAAPNPIPIPNTPKILGSRSFGTTYLMMAIVLGVSKAPPTACSDRKIIRK